MSSSTAKFRKIGVRLGAVACVAGLALGTVGASGADAAASTAARPAASAAVHPGVSPIYVQWDSKIPTIQACVEEGENLKEQGIIDAFACVSGPGGFILWVHLITSCPGVVSGPAARVAEFALQPAAC